MSFAKVLLSDSYNNSDIANKSFQSLTHSFQKMPYKEICGEIEYLTRKKYTNLDLTFGAYILLQVANFKIICKKCQKSSTHKEKYYLNDCIVTIITE
jgi:hypothetical protein